MTKPFAWDIKHFPTVAAFAAYLNTLTRPTWCVGVTLHHTYIPTIDQWHGYTSMVNLGVYYRDDVLNTDGSRGWPSGPQLFIGPDGIWQGTPVTQKGTHAGSCNKNRIGVEIVGNYDPAPWQEPIKSLVYGAVTELLPWLGKNETAINGHRDCGSTKTCPGRAIDLNVVRSKVKTMLSLTQSVPVGFYPVAAQIKAAYELSGGVWRTDRFAPGYAITPLKSHSDGARYQLFERTGARLLADGRIEWIRTDEVEALRVALT